MAQTRKEVAARYYASLSPERKRQHRLNAEARRQKDPDRFLGYALRRHHGITVGEFRKLEKAQRGVCRICGSPPRAGSRLAVDHSHLTGKIRGLLCLHCNTGLGNFEEDPKLLQRAADYLKGPK